MPQSHTFRLMRAARCHGLVELQLAVTCPRALHGWVRAVVAAAWPEIPAFRSPWQLSIRLCDAPEAQAANQNFRHKGYVPDVLTFPLWEQGPTRSYAGDILICWPKLMADAATQGKKTKAHLQHLIIHGLLHLAGEDHQTPAQATRMERQEIRILKTLGWPNPYELL